MSEETATEIEAEQEESKEEPRLRRNSTKRDSIPRSLSSSGGNNSSKEHENKINPYQHFRSSLASETIFWLFTYMG